MSKWDLDKMNKKIIPDPFTGGNQTVYWKDDGTFMMSIPDRAIQLPAGTIFPKVEWIDNPDGSKTWSITDEQKDKEA